MRFLGIFFSIVIAVSAAFPWVDSPQIGSWSLVDVAIRVADGEYPIEDVVADITPPQSIDPNRTFLIALVAFALSFPLAVLFSVIGILNYYSKFMGVFLGGIPICLMLYVGYGIYELGGEGGNLGLQSDLVRQTINLAMEHIGIGLPTYGVGGLLLFMSAVFAPARRNV